MKKQKNMDPKPGVRPKDKLTAVLAPLSWSGAIPIEEAGLWFVSQKAFATLMADGKWHRAVYLKHSVQYKIPPEYIARLKGKGIGETSDMDNRMNWWFDQTMTDMEKYGYIRHVERVQGRGRWFTRWVQITPHGQRCFRLPSKPLESEPPPSIKQEC